MTVVFTDLVGSTSLGERLDPESLSEKFIGDAIMAVFGIPTLHEDDALRGVLALRADDFVDLLFQQLGQHTEPDADAQRQQSTPSQTQPAAPAPAAPLRQHHLIHARLRDRYVAPHGGSSSIFDGSPVTAPNRSGRAGGTAVPRSSTSYGTTSGEGFLEGSAPVVGPPGGVGDFVPAGCRRRAAATKNGGDPGWDRRRLLRYVVSKRCRSLGRPECSCGRR